MITDADKENGEKDACALWCWHTPSVYDM